MLQLVIYFKWFFRVGASQKVIIKFWPGQAGGDGYIHVRTRGDSVADLSAIVALAMAKNKEFETAVIVAVEKWPDLQQIIEEEGL